MNDDFSKAMKIRCLSAKTLDKVRKNIMPLPSYPTLKKKFAWTHFTPGIVKLALAYLNKILPEMPEKDRLCSLLFDEIKTTNRGQMDKKLDMVIGENCLEAQVSLIRSLCAKWKIINFCEPEFFLIQKLKSYTEISVSRDQIKIF